MDLIDIGLAGLLVFLFYGNSTACLKNERARTNRAAKREERAAEKKKGVEAVAKDSVDIDHTRSIKDDARAFFVWMAIICPALLFLTADRNLLYAAGSDASASPKYGLLTRWFIPEYLVYMIPIMWFYLAGVLLFNHRMFSHRGFLPANRAWQFVFGCWGVLGGQAGPVTWASWHRHHHHHCEHDTDSHSPHHSNGWFYNNYLVNNWMLRTLSDEVKVSGVPLLSKSQALSLREHVALPFFQFLYPQGCWLLDGFYPRDDDLVACWLDNFPELRVIDDMAPFLWWTHMIGLRSLLQVYAPLHWWNLTCYCVLWPWLLTWHAVMLVNSVSHMDIVGSSTPYKNNPVQVGETCVARNIWWLWPIMLGANWHNNHHAYAYSCREGFEWWEIDPLYYFVRLLEFVGAVKKLQYPRQDRLLKKHADVGQIPRATAA